jgi:hypothetical protein
LTKKFFKDNPVKELTVQQFVYSQMQMPELSRITSDYIRRLNNRAEDEKEILLKENDPDKLLKMLRGKCDVLNHHILHQKILEQEEVLIPIILKMLKTNMNSAFIENTVKILVKTKNNYSEILLKILDEIKDLYAMSLACIALGFIADENAIPILISKLSYFKNTYPEQNLEQGPLLGLYELNFRFYGGYPDNVR